MMKMKRLLFKRTWVFAFFFISKSLVAQDVWSSFAHVINEQGYAGQKFRYRAFVRVEKEDSSATVGLWLRVDRNQKYGFFDNMADRPISSSEWKEYYIEGTFDEDYTQTAFGILTMYNGKFYLDDVNLEVQTKDKKWISIYKTDFEEEIIDWAKGIGAGTSGINDFARVELSNTNAKSGNQCLAVNVNGAPNYGANDKIGKFANVNGINLYYEVYGEGHPLVVLHGNGSSIGNATPHFPDLIKKYKVIAVDSRAQGKSSDTEMPLTYELMASDIAALLDELKIDSAYVWGHSDGAILGLMLAMNHPNKVKKVLAFGANIQADSSAIFSWALNAIKNDAKENKDPRIRKLNQLMAQEPNVPYSRLSEIKIPVLVMSGDRDIIRLEHTIQLFQNIPKSQLCIIPGTTHSASWDKKDLFLGLLYDFFDKPFTMPSSEDWFR